MISYLSGTIKDYSGGRLIIDVHGVGYSVIVPEMIAGDFIKTGSEIELYIYSTLNIREGSFALYGFKSLSELRFFELLISVSGVGPKNTQNILSHVDIPTLQLAIIKGDDLYLKKLSGIGSKTAQRIIIDLKNKVMATDFGHSEDRDFQKEGEAIDAMITLGYSMLQARDALNEVSKEAKSTEERVKEALKILGNSK